jgi:hypothetical protein
LAAAPISEVNSLAPTTIQTNYAGINSNVVALCIACLKPSTYFALAFVLYFEAYARWWPGTESNGQGALKTGKLLIFQRPRNPKNLQKPVWRYIRGTRKIAKLVSTHQHLAKRITEKKLKSSISDRGRQKNIGPERTALHFFNASPKVAPLLILASLSWS